MSPSQNRQQRRGSALGITMVFAGAIAIIVAGLFRWAGTERNITRRDLALTKARSAAESVGAYGEAQVIARLDRLVYFPDDEFLPGRNPVHLSPPASDDPVTEVLALTTEGLISTTLGIAEELEATVLGTVLLPSEPAGGDGSTQPSGQFQYEITPENLVVGRFTPARWVTVRASNPLYSRDPLVDQTARMREVAMYSAARVVDLVQKTTTRAFCEYRLQVRDIPVWGYAMFYNMDLEIAPGAAMDVFGPVHANGDLFVQTGASLKFHNMVTTAGRLFHGRANGIADSWGDIMFRKGGTTDYVSLYQDSGWLDSRSSGWASSASNLWAGNLRTKTHGTNPSTVPGMAAYVPDDPATDPNELVNDAHALIEPAIPDDNASYPGDEIETQKFASKACLVIEIGSSGGVAIYKYRQSSSGKYIRNIGSGPQRFSRVQLDVPAGLIVGGAASEKFYDKRRARWVSSADIDVSKLKTLVESSEGAAEFTKAGVTFSPGTDWNGVVYVDHKQSAAGGVRLVNGSSVPDRATSANGYVRGFTLATNAPLYIQGNYNANGTIDSESALIQHPDSDSEPPAGLAGDAVTILSNNWSDASSSLDLDARIATQTEVSAALMTGIVPTNKSGTGMYSGGVENLPRFLEDWSDVKFGYRGSMVVLFESERATEPWGSSNVYSPPDRNWAFNSLFAEGVLPPGNPVSRTYRRIGFRDCSESEYQAAIAAIADD